MDRRDFIKGAVFATTMMPFGIALATEYEEKGSVQEDTNLLRLRNRENPTAMEQKHVPGIEAPNKVEKGKFFDVKVRVGYINEHPSTPDHWITWIKLLVNGHEVARTEYEMGGVSWSHATFKIKLEKTSTLEAIENCNLHGTWIGDPLTITV